jgi:competence protein ComEA
MKANFFAAALSLFIVSIAIHAASSPSNRQVTKVSQTAQVKIDLNKADAISLSKSIKGIGQKRAEAIIKYRKDHGKFKSIDDLAKVKGFSKQFVKSHLSQLKELFIVVD